ncbi:hypothetical protein [Klebsiella pneumoniae]|uniref:hypothetical protein n=1 Tax=Klebsiella pneumoniae TaxID=573 RepID=UPI0005896988|nr:hypothetical protein [Klebsiella pneumoniae]
MNLETVNELIASMESAGELSIREQKFLKLAKAFKQLAAENVAMKDINAWCKTDAFKNMYREFKTAEALGCSDADCMHDAMLVAIMHAPATPATDRIVDEAEARGVERAIVHLEKKFSNIGVQIMNLQWLADSLRKGADKC